MMRTVTAARLVAAASAAWLPLAGCADAPMAQRAATAEEVPLRFAYGGLANIRPAYRAADDGRRGFAVRRAMIVGRDEFAIFDMMRTLGDSYIPRRATSLWVRGMVEEKDRDAIEWGRAGDIRGGVRQTGYQTFRMPDRESACVGLQRSLRDHNSGVFGEHSQLMVVGLYCRRGSEQIGAEEVRAIAGALQA